MITDKELMKRADYILRKAPIDMFAEPFCSEYTEDYASAIYAASQWRINDVSSGATKLVIDFADANKVIKIPFSHQSGYSYHYSSAEGEYVEDYESPPEMFKGALNSMNHWDYCLAEQENYFASLQYGLGCFFCPTEQIGDYNEYPIYAQPKCQSIEALDVSFGKWEKDLKDNYGIELFYQWEDFCHHYEITDLNSDNIGYTLQEGFPCCFDYSSFFS